MSDQRAAVRTPSPAVRRGKAGTTGPRPKGAGGIVALQEGVWRVDVEISRDPVTGARRRVSRRVRGSREDAEIALARLRVADHDGRLPRPGTTALTVRAALIDYVRDAERGVIDLAPRTVVTTRSAANTMSAVTLADGRVFGDIRLAQLGWQDIEGLFRRCEWAASAPRGSDVRRRCSRERSIAPASTV